VSDTYHQRIKQEKRTAVLDAATALFLEQGYDRTSLAQVAGQAGVSTATLFKRFPTKAALLQAIVQAFWEADDPGQGFAPAGNPRTGLRRIGRDYVRRMRRPGMAGIYRLVIAEAPRFPELGRVLAEQGMGACVAGLTAYLEAETAAGTLAVPDAARAARQFLAVIAGQAFWPELLVPGCAGSEADADAAVDQAVALMLARYVRKPAPGGAALPAKIRAE